MSRRRSSMNRTIAALVAGVVAGAVTRAGACYLWLGPAAPPSEDAPESPVVGARPQSLGAPSLGEARHERREESESSPAGDAVTALIERLPKPRPVKGDVSIGGDVTDEAGRP